MKKNKPFSYFKGFTFSFEDEGKLIEAWFSVFSGLEKVSVNGEIVSSQRNYSTNSSNHFKIGENEYSTSLRTESLLKGPFICTLSKNGNAFKRKKLVFQRAVTKVLFIRRFLFFIFLGIVFGFSINYFGFPNWSIYILLAVLFILAFANKIREPIIEDEEIV